MSECVAINCKNKLGEADGKTFHRFPFWNPALLQQWIKKVDRPNWTLTCTSLLCSDHFEKDCFDTIGEITRIKGSAVPTIFNKVKIENEAVLRLEPGIYTLEETDVRYEDSSCISHSTVTPQIITLVSLENLLRTVTNQGSRIQVEDNFRKVAKRKLNLELQFSIRRLVNNQQKIKMIMMRSRLLRRRMMQISMLMMLLAQDKFDHNS